MRTPGGQDWQTGILADFDPALAAVTRVTLVADPDGILTSPDLRADVQCSGFEVLDWDDPQAFRYQYENRFRLRWDRGEHVSLVVRVGADRGETARLPHDVVSEAERSGRFLSFGLSDLFPGFAGSVLAELSPSDRDELARCQRSAPVESRNEDQTRDFVLRHVYGVAPETIRSPQQLLRVLLERHYGERWWAPSVEQFFVTVLRRRNTWKDWPLEQIVPDRGAFFAFLEERWPLFLQRELAGREKGGCEQTVPFGMRVPGPATIPFDHADVRPFLDNLFAEGLVAPTDRVPWKLFQNTWMAAGVIGSQEQDDLGRLLRLLGQLERDVQGNPDYLGWMRIALRRAEAEALQWTLARERLLPELDRIRTVEERVDAAFGAWLSERYGTLCSLPCHPKPAMVHHVPRFLARGMAGPAAAGRRRALVVVDGLAMWQWAVLRDALVGRGGFLVEDGAVFAWVPTRTEVSRQAIFAGEPPFRFADSICNNNKEAAHWTRFWVGQGLKEDEVAYLRQGLADDDGSFVGKVKEAAERPRVRVLGVVVNRVDRLLHGAELGLVQVCMGLKVWEEFGTPADLLASLLERGYEVYLTSDHGNVEATGIGRIDMGALPDVKGERVLVFPDATLRSQALAKEPGAIPWPTEGLPEGYFPLLAPDRAAFTQQGVKTVTHGGAAMNEVLVPFARIERKTG